MDLILQKFEKNYPKLSLILRFLISFVVSIIANLFVFLIASFVLDKSKYANVFEVLWTYENLSPVAITLASALGLFVNILLGGFLLVTYVFKKDIKCALKKNRLLVLIMISAIEIIISLCASYLFIFCAKTNKWIFEIVFASILFAFNFFITYSIFVRQEKPTENLNDYEINKNKNLEDLKIKKDNKQSKYSVFGIVLNLLFCLSSVALMLLFYQRRFGGSWFASVDYVYAGIYGAVTFVVLALILFFILKKTILDMSLKNKTALFASIVFSAITLLVINDVSLYANKAKTVLLVLASFSVFVYVHLFVSFVGDRCKKFWSSLSKTERFAFFIMIGVGTIVGVISFLFTNGFVNPKYWADSIFSYDTGLLIKNKSQINIFLAENDFRHFLMTLAMFPFAVLPYFVYMTFEYNFIYGALSFFVQVLLISYCIITIVKLLKINEDKFKIFAYVAMFISAGFLFNMLIVEKFVISCFYIISTLKLCEENNDAKWLTLLGAVGILTTNIVLLFIVVFYNKTNLNKAVSEILTFIALFVLMIMIFGQFNLVINVDKYIDPMNFAGNGVGFGNRIVQTLTFVASVFCCPNFKVLDNGAIAQASASFNEFAILGLVILIAVVVSTILNWKDKFSRTCFVWNVFMIVLLLGVGWGSALDEMFIYSLIFGWSLISSVIMLFKNFGMHKNLMLTIVSFMIILIAFWNTYSLVLIVEAARETFPGILFETIS